MKCYKNWTEAVKHKNNNSQNRHNEESCCFQQHLKIMDTNLHKLTLHDTKKLLHDNISVDQCLNG